MNPENAVAFDNAALAPPVALTIAGSDSGGGAGIQADLLTFAAHRVHGTSVLTAVTAQNTLGVTGSHLIPPEFVIEQLVAVTSDFDVKAAKTGMLAGRDQLVAVTESAPELLVVDPVLVSTSGAVLYAGDPADYLQILAPRSTVFTPNLPEAELLLGRNITCPRDRRQAVLDMATHGPDVVVLKGGHGDDPEAVDLCLLDGELFELARPRVATANGHGTGCTFAAAITACLARGESIRRALETAKDYVTRGLVASVAWRLGGGPGPFDHFPGSDAIGPGSA